MNISEDLIVDCRRLYDVSFCPDVHRIIEMGSVSLSIFPAATAKQPDRVAILIQAGLMPHADLQYMPWGITDPDGCLLYTSPSPRD